MTNNWELTTLLNRALELVNSGAALREKREPVGVANPPEAVYGLCWDMATFEQEQMRVLLVDTKNRVRRIVLLYQGTLNASVVRIAELFRDAIRDNAAAIIVVHNHPSGDPNPSQEDDILTRRLREAGNLLQMPLVDHIVIADGRWYPYASSGRDWWGE